MIIKTDIKNADDIFLLEKNPHHCDYFSNARYNELIPMLIDLYKEDTINPVNLTPYTVINICIEFSSLTILPEKQKEEVLKETLGELRVQGREEFTDPIWMVKKEKYRYNPTNIEEYATILGAIYYTRCFNPDFYAKETLLTLCLKEMNSDTEKNIFNRFKNKADSIIKNYVDTHPVELKKAGLTTIGHYWLPDISDLYKYENIEKELESIDQLGKDENAPSRVDVPTREVATFIHYMFKHYKIEVNKNEIINIIHYLTKKNRKNIGIYINEITRTGGITSTAKNSCLRVAKDISIDLNKLSDFIIKNTEEE